MESQICYNHDVAFLYKIANVNLLKSRAEGGGGGSEHPSVNVFFVLKSL